MFLELLHSSSKRGRDIGEITQRLFKDAGMQASPVGMEFGPVIKKVISGNYQVSTWRISSRPTSLEISIPTRCAAASVRLVTRPCITTVGEGCPANDSLKGWTRIFPRCVRTTATGLWPRTRRREI